jgi:hypothetical protein
VYRNASNAQDKGRFAAQEQQPRPEIACIGTASIFLRDDLWFPGVQARGRSNSIFISQKEFIDQF